MDPGVESESYRAGPRSRREHKTVIQGERGRSGKAAAYLDVLAPGIRLADGLHHIEHVVRELPGRARLLASAQCECHFNYTEPAKIAGTLSVVVEEWNLSPNRLVLVGSYPHRTSEIVGIRNAQNPFRAVELHVGEVVAPDSEAVDESRLGAAFEFDQSRHERGGAHLEGLARPRAAERCTCGIQDSRHSGNPAHRAQQAIEGGEVGGPGIEQRASAGLIEKTRIRMPVLWAAIEHECGGGQRFAKFSLLQQAKTGLNARAQKGVRRARDSQAAGRGRIQDAPPVVAGRSKRLFREHVLAGAKGRHADLSMC